MGSVCSSKGENAEPSGEIWLDKVIKYAVIPPILLLAIIGLILLYAVDRVNCTSNRARDIHPISDVNQYCWSNPRPATLETIVNYTIFNDTLYSTPPPNATKVTYHLWVEGSALIRHKIFPILLVVECVCLAIPLLIWYWCIATELRSHTKALIAHANRLTAAYQKYDHSQSKQDEASVHRELDNYLEYFSYLLSSKAQRMFILHLAKWIVVLIISIAWFAGNLGLFSPDFVIFRDSFTCLYSRSNNLAYDCYFKTSLYLRIVWYINIVVLGILIILILLYIIVGLCRARKYENTFFHGSIPGTMDPRLSRSIQKNYNPRHYWLLSKMCEENEILFTDPGLAKSLARKYGTGSYQRGPNQMGDNSEPGTDEKPAFVKQTQIDRFQKVADESEKSSPLCCGSCLGTGSSNGVSGKKRSQEVSLGDSINQRCPEPEPVFGQNNNIGSKQPVADDEFTPRELLNDSFGHGQVVGDGLVKGSIPTGHLNQANSRRDNKLDRSKDFTPDHLYFRELIRYKHPNGIKPEYPVDYEPAPLFNQQSAHPDPNPYNTWGGSPTKVKGPYGTDPGFNDVYPNSVSAEKNQPPLYGRWKAPRRVVFSLPRNLRRGRVKKRRIASVSAKDPDVIVLEDIEEYAQSNTPSHNTESHNSGHKLHYPSPYSGSLSSRVIMPYYDADTETYTNLNPLAYKLRKTVREKMARDAKVWKP